MIPINEAATTLRRKLESGGAKVVCIGSRKGGTEFVVYLEKAFAGVPETWEDRSVISTVVGKVRPAS